ncbi:MAG: ketoacyl-ACP synthase III [Ardenticatenaceae bacterium]|nr:ketoacyl-ACP synthase III [Ardenticatenaceae bacterium]MCB8990138.1 ketoacyl-ACP synthase III [Ardenticatenaceae bacterium]
MRYAQILGNGRYIPQRIVTNDDLNEMLGENVGDWLVANVGIRERHVMANDETTSSMVVAASEQALARAGITAADLNLIIVATDTPDFISPATASAVQDKLGAVNAGTYDINCACAAWVTGLDMAARYIATDTDYRYILVAGGYGMTKFLDWGDKYTATLFADGAGAVIVGVGDQPGFLAGKLMADGQYYDAMGIYTGGTGRPATPETIAEFGKPRVQFVKKFPATFNSDNWPPLVRGVVAKAGLTLNEIDFYLFTQLNLRTIEFVMDNLGQPMSKTHWIMDKWGYLGSACIPAALDDALERGKGPKPGDNVVFCATGGGMAMAATAWKWTGDSNQ